MTRLPRRDLILLPAVVLATTLVLLGCAELVARHYFPDPETDTCFYRSPKGPADRANCMSYERTPESPQVRNVFDACGYRSLQGCGEKRPGVVRIAVIGSSIAEARLVPLEDSYMALAGSRFEFIPVAAPLSSPAHSLARMDEVLALHPDAVIQILTPVDIETLWMYVQNGKLNLRPEQSIAEHGHDFNHYFRAVSDTLKDSRAALAAEHFIFNDADRFLRLYMMYGYKADYLRQPFSAAWRQRFSELNWVDDQIAERLRQAGLPFYITAFPSRADAMLLRRDPAAFAWGREVAAMAEREHAQYIDLLHAFAQTSDPRALFYTVDGHPNAAAQPLIANALMSAVTGETPNR